MDFLFFMKLFSFKCCKQRNITTAGPKYYRQRSWVLVSVGLDVLQISGQHPLRWHWWILCDRRKPVHPGHPWVFRARQVLSFGKWRGKMFVFMSRNSSFCGSYTVFYIYTVHLLSQVRNPISWLHQLENTHRECQEMKAFTKAFLQQVTESQRLSIISRGELLLPDKAFQKVLQPFWINQAQSDLWYWVWIHCTPMNCGKIAVKGLCFVFFQISVLLRL